MVARAMKLNSEFTDNFMDIPQNSYYYNEMGILKQLGIVNGSGKYFFPDNNITREDSFTIIFRVIKSVHPDFNNNSIIDLAKFNDKNKISNYAVEPISALGNTGIIKGYNGNIYPKSYITRAETSVLIQKYFKAN